MSLPRADEALLEPDGSQLGRNWYAFFDRLWKGQTTEQRLQPSTVASLPTRAADGSTRFVTDAAGGACPAYCSSNTWYRFSDNSVVS